MLVPSRVIELPSHFTYNCIAVLIASVMSEFVSLILVGKLTLIDEAKYCVHMNTCISWIPVIQAARTTGIPMFQMTLRE